MIEVTFSDSAGGGLKCARAYSDELAKSEIVCLGVMADIGDITEPMFGEYRYNLICKMLYQEQWGPDPEMKAELKRLGRYYAKNYLRLKRGLKNGEPVRVWCDNSPSSMCGMLWLSGLLTKHKAEVYAVELRRFNYKSNAVTGPKRVYVLRRDWGECEPAEFADALPAARRIPSAELAINAFEWRRLVNENSRLRAVIAGHVVSVPVDFYDFLIRKYLGKTPMKEALLIGKILGGHQLGVGDWWYARRIEYYIRKKTIVISEDNECRYQRLIALA